MESARPHEAPPARRHDRRARERTLYTVDQLLGRAPIRLRRRTDKVRLAAHVVAIIALVALSAWWVLPRHEFAGPVLFILVPGRGVHVGDLPTVAFLAVAARSLRVAGSIVRTTRH